ncbi:MAG TPA: glycosyltransferase [Thermoleophilia bacterium]|nr:glycosyltransferase [Thermoleophilia bacterium]
MTGAVTGAVAYFGTYDPDHPRNAVLLAGLRERGVTVHEFRAPLPALDAAAMATGAGAARVAGGVLAAHARLAAQHRRRLAADAVIVGYPGHLVVPFARVVAGVRRARLVFDPLVSLGDTFSGDRGLVAERSGLGAAFAVADRVAFGCADLVLADTGEQAVFYGSRFGVPRERLAVVPVGALPEPQATGAARPLSAGEPLVVFQYGKWSPLHGADTVLAAAARLRDRPVRFVLAGEGQLSATLRAEAARLALENVEWVGMQSPAQLRARTLAADVCLGAFGTSAKARRVVPTKVHEALACGRPVVTGDSAAARELLQDGVDALLVSPGDGRALAATVERLLDERLRGALGVAALALYRRALTPAAVAGRLLAALEQRP